jgi:ketosteroid isomerase-like protein
MKSIISCLAVVTLSFVASAIAQEESPSPATEETASATVEQTAAPTPESTATPEAMQAPAAPEKSATPTETRKATAAAPSKTATPAMTKSTEAAASAKPGKKMSGEGSVKDMEDKWEAAVGTHDIATVQGYVAADFVGVSSKNKFVSRSSLLSEFKGDKDTYKSAKNEKLNVKSFGPNVTVVTGRAREKGMAKDGKQFDRTFLFTDTWVLRAGQWQCVASQVSQIK